MKQIKYIVSFGCLFFGISSFGQSLNDYIKVALKNNPEIQSFELKHQIAEEKINESATLSNTEFGAGYFVSQPETRTGPQQFKLSVKQMLPWFGTITARENYSNSLADALYTEITIAKRKLILSITESYYKLYALQAKQEVLKEQIDLLRHYEQIALTGVEVGRISAVKILQLQIRENVLDEKRRVFEQEFLGELVAFNFLLNQEKNTNVVVIPSLEIPTQTAEIKVENLQLHPELLKYDALYNSVTQAELLNQKNTGPNLGLGLDYINVLKRTDMDVIDNGKDIFMPMVSISVPVFNKSVRSKTIQNKLQQEDLEIQKTLKINQLTTYLEMALKNRTNAKISYETQLKNIEQAINAEEILIKSYETESIDFNDLLDILKLQLNIQLNKIEAIKNYYLQSALINYITNN